MNSLSSRDKNLLLALAAYILAPVCVIAGVAAHTLLDPELARHTTNYVRTYNVIQVARTLLLGGCALTAALMGLASCWFALKARGRSWWPWILLATLGPFGLALLTALLPDQGDSFKTKLGWLLRLALEAAFICLVSAACYAAIVSKRELMIVLESIMTGVSAEKIRDIQNQSSGMWAFGESLQGVYLLGLIYLARPIGLRLAFRLKSVYSRSP